MAKKLPLRVFAFLLTILLLSVNTKNPSVLALEHFSNTTQQSCPYKLPWPKSLPAIDLGQGYRGPYTHFRNTKMEYSIDFSLDEGMDVLATRGGTVGHVQTGYTACGGRELANKANYVVLDHGDGTSALYLHLSEVLVTKGQVVSQGQLVGKSGKTGWTGKPGGKDCGPHLHYQVQKTNGWYTRSISACFEEVADIFKLKTYDTVVSSNGVSATAKQPTEIVPEFVTEIQYITPSKISGEVRNYGYGNCWAHSIVSPRNETWRCSAESFIYDPCFAVPNEESYVLCDVDPRYNPKAGAFVLYLTEPLPAEKVDSNNPFAIAITLEDGIECNHASGGGTMLFVEDKPITFWCYGQGAVVILDWPKMGIVWTAIRAQLSEDQTQVTESHEVRIKTVIK